MMDSQGFSSPINFTGKNSMAGRLTVHKTVYWKEAGGRERSGKVKLVMPGHVVVAASGHECIVRRDLVYLKKPGDKRG